MGSFGAHGRGDQRNVWLWIDGGMAEITPNEDTHAAARELAKGFGQSWYFRRVRTEGRELWAAYSVKWMTGVATKAFPNQDAAVMYALAMS